MAERDFFTLEFTRLGGICQSPGGGKRRQRYSWRGKEDQVL